MRWLKQVTGCDKNHLRNNPKQDVDRENRINTQLLYTVKAQNITTDICLDDLPAVTCSDRTYRKPCIGYRLQYRKASHGTQAEAA